ncbi:MAG: TnpV protein [Clostridia bacterium]|nr:TnpV protein [Clostridia bacterium]
MEQLSKFITDERTGLKYELCGDYYIIAGEDEPEREPIGVWGQRHLNYIKKNCKPFYNKMLNEDKLYDYLLQLDRDAEEMFSRLVRQIAEREGIAKQLKDDNQMEWVARMNNIRQRATEIVNSELIYN